MDIDLFQKIKGEDKVFAIEIPPSTCRSQFKEGNDNVPVKVSLSTWHRANIVTSLAIPLS